MDPERRSVPRYTYIAHAELADKGRSTRLNVRISDISTKGCYVDMLHPLPAGTDIILDIADSTGPIQAKGRIVYSVPQLGAGVAFLDLAPEVTAQIERSVRDLAS
jgi:PilZ domain-containing protein